ncbi:MAG TPA: acyltransferase, partial [Bradyrhizobium sp.]
GESWVERDRLPGLQVARAVAALSIAYFHSWVALVRFPKDTAFPLPILTGHGWLAVDLFFAISGFVICLVVSRPGFSVGSFLIKRVFRLYPLWLATLTIFAVLALLWRGPTETETLRYFLYSATLLPTEQFPFYNIGWSLQHEMFFYLIAAVIAPIFGLYGIAAFLAASTIAFHTIEMPWYFSSLAMYHPEFLAGVLAFMVRPKLAKLGFWLPFSIGFASLWYFVAVWGDRYYVPIALFFLIAGFSNIRDKQSRWLKSVSAIGDASYSIYLLHPLVFLVVSALVSKVTLPIWAEEPIRAGCFVLILSVSLASWRYFERPMIGLGNMLASRRVGHADVKAHRHLELQTETPPSNDFP